MPKVSLMSQAEYARHRGVDPTSVRDAIAHGRITVVVVDGKKMIDPVAADAQWQAHSRPRLPNGNMERATEVVPAAAPPAQPPGQPLLDGPEDLWASRARREAAEADLAELKLAEQQGQLVRAADVRAALSKKAAALRESVLQIPARLAPVLAAEADAGKVHDQLQAELHAVLAQFVET